MCLEIDKKHSLSSRGRRRRRGGDGGLGEGRLIRGGGHGGEVQGTFIFF